MKILLALLITLPCYGHAKEYRAKLIRVIDGDTLDARIDLGFDITVKKRIRLYGVDAPELRTRDRAEKRRGIAVKNAVESYLEDAQYLRIKAEGTGKFGRTLGVVYKGRARKSLNELVREWSK